MFLLKDIVITKPDKGNRVLILDRKLYNNAIEEIISNTSNSKSSVKTQPWNAKFHHNIFCVSWNKKNFNEIEYDKLYPSVSAPVRINGTPEMHKFCSSDSFRKFRPIVSSRGTFN